MEQEKEEYLVEGELIFHSYVPDKLVKGMKFLTKRIVNGLSPELYFFTLKEVPDDPEHFMEINGAPMIMNIITTGEDGEIIALHDEIGLFEEHEMLRSIGDEEINVIINQYGGVLNVESDETGDPILYEGKVIISYLSELDGEEVNDGNG